MKKIGISLLIVLFSFGFSLKAQVYNPITYNYNGTPSYGIKIKTNIPYTSGTQMPTIIFEGYNFGQRLTIGLTLAYYIYGGEFYN
ncbi:MAG: hypothetical protein P1P88_11850 [Bacteroidales bacterium]|nr:hypothetical protein [Bacteroidales bacterium]